jgi:hypothetical protein
MAMRRPPLTLVLLAAAALAPAQRVVSAKSGFVYFAIGHVWVDNGPLKSGEIERQLQNGETLYTERGRAEILLNPGTVLRVGDMSRFRMEDVRLTDACVSLLNGSAVVTIKFLPNGDRVMVHLGSSAVVALSRPGVYRFDSGKLNVDQARLRVYDGIAQVQLDASTPPVSVGGGKSILLDDLRAVKFNAKETDALQRWADSRSRSMPAPPQPPRPVPPRTFEASTGRPQ